MTKTTPISLRIKPEADALVRSIAAEERRSRSATAAELLDEAARMRKFPGIGFRSTGSGRRAACLLGTRFDVRRIVEIHRSVSQVDEVLDNWPISEHQLQLALAYYKAYRSEIDTEIEDDQEAFEEATRLYPDLRA